MDLFHSPFTFQNSSFPQAAAPRPGGSEDVYRIFYVVEGNRVTITGVTHRSQAYS